MCLPDVFCLVNVFPNYDRYAALLQREIASRDQAESNELRLKRELEQLKVVHKHLLQDAATIKEDFNTKACAWETERTLINNDWNKRLSQIVAEKDQAMAQVSNLLSFK